MVMPVRFYSDDNYLGEGVSKGLARGLIASYNGDNITREGMGICAVALRKNGYTYFSRSSNTEQKNQAFSIYL
jgi:hypothetical protein